LFLPENFETVNASAVESRYAGRDSTPRSNSSTDVIAVFHTAVGPVQNSLADSQYDVQNHQAKQLILQQHLRMFCDVFIKLIGVVAPNKSDVISAA
jgi:hypothetical protein